MGVRETQPEDDGGIATPCVDTTPAAQPPSPRPSITGAETAHRLDVPHLDGFLLSVDWLAFTVPSSTVCGSFPPPASVTSKFSMGSNQARTSWQAPTRQSAS